MPKCKGICDRFAARRPPDRFRYIAGQRSCSVCGIFIDIRSIESLRCPCCSNKLRMTSRNSKYRVKIRH